MIAEKKMVADMVAKREIMATSLKWIAHKMDVAMKTAKAKAIRAKELKINLKCIVVVVANDLHKQSLSQHYSLLLIFAHSSFKVTIRLNTNFPGLES